MGQINIGGANAAVQLQGNDTITTDQAFTFPDAGGELLTAAGNTTNTGNGGTAGQGQVVGYQKGVWTPYAMAANDKALSGISAYEQQAGSWVRIGDLLALQWWIYSSDSSWSYINGTTKDTAFEIGGLPYAVSTTSPFTYNSGTIGFLKNTEQGKQFRCYTMSSGDAPRIRFACSNGTPNKDTGASYERIFGDIGSAIQGAITYISNDTTWTPINGATIQ